MFWRWLLCLFMLSLAGQAIAHPASESRMMLAVDEHSVGIALYLPVEQLSVAMPEARHWNTLRHVATDKLQSYLAEHLQLRSLQRLISVQVNEASVQTIDQESYVVARLTAAADDENALRTLRLHYDGIQHRVINHRTLLYLSSDIWSGEIGAHPQLLDILRYGHNELDIQRTGDSRWYGFTQIILHGTRHILEGSDHLAFLISLLMVTGLKRRRTGWMIKPATLKDSLILVSAFALGHCATLALNTLLPVPSIGRWVEAAVAVSVLLAALNLSYPLFWRSTPLLAVLFGLIHGMAFASALNIDGLQLASKLVALTGFSIGLELVQIVLVLALLPCINLWRQSRAYQPISVLVSILISIFALIWLGQQLAPQWFLPELSFSLSTLATLMIVIAVIVISAIKYAMCLPSSRKQRQVSPI